MHRLILPRHILREHIGPFCFSFSAITLVFLLDLLFRQLNRILSKGLPWAVVVEFFVLNMAWIVATAVPMAVLSATLMAFGRLAADNEITAMQACGISLWRQVRPVFIAAALLAAGLIWFNDHVLPDCNHRVRVLATDIARKKPGVAMEPGIWYNGIPNYSLLAQTLEDSADATKAYQLLINDDTQPEVRRTISAGSGLIQLIPTAGTLLLTLFDGEIQEINIQKLEEFRRLRFSKHVMSIAAEEMFLRRSESELRNDREKSTQEMRQEVQALRAERTRLEQELERIMRADPGDLAGNSVDTTADRLTDLSTSTDFSFLAQQRQLFHAIEEKRAEIKRAARIAQSLLVEIHKKYAIAVACIVFVLIGAPLGMLARRGGIATGVGLSLGFFLLYWAFLIGGEDLADRQMVSPFLAMWSANLFTGALGIAIFWSISTGNLNPAALKMAGVFGQIFSGDLWRRIIGRFRRSNEEVNSKLRQPEKKPTKPESKESPVALPPPALAMAAPPAPTLPPPTPSKPRLDLSPAMGILEQLVHRTRAHFALLCDRNGMSLTHATNPTAEFPPFYNFERIATVAAGQMATTREIGHSLGENGSFSSIFQEGRKQNTFIYQIDQDFILIVLADKTVMIGLVRLHAQEAVAGLRKALH